MNLMKREKVGAINLKKKEKEIRGYRIQNQKGAGRKEQ